MRSIRFKTQNVSPSIRSTTLRWANLRLAAATLRTHSNIMPLRSNWRAIRWSRVFSSIGLARAKELKACLEYAWATDYPKRHNSDRIPTTVAIDSSLFSHISSASSKAQEGKRAFYGLLTTSPFPRARRRIFESPDQRWRLTRSQPQQ